MLFEVTLFAAVALLIAPLGAIQVAGHQVALNFSSLLFMDFTLSIGTAATIHTGCALGRKSVSRPRGKPLLMAFGTWRRAARRR